MHYPLMTMFRNEGSASNGDLHSMNDISLSESAVHLVCFACETSVLFTRLICDWCQLMHRIVHFRAGRSWQIPNKSLGFCHAPSSRKTITRFQVPRVR